MKPAADLDPVAPGVVCWHAYDSASRVELWSTCVRLGDGSLLIDPIPLDNAALDELERQLGRPVAIALTNANHERAADEYRTRFSIPIFAKPDPAFTIPIDANATDLGARWPELGVIELPGAGPGEWALTIAPLRLVVIGDAIINLESAGFMLLPAKYCTDAKQARLSANRLVEYAPEMMTFAHGSPVLSGAAGRIRSLVE
jgi:hypothetical protein